MEIDLSRIILGYVNVMGELYSAANSRHYESLYGSLPLLPERVPVTLTHIFEGLGRDYPECEPFTRENIGAEVDNLCKEGLLVSKSLQAIEMIPLKKDINAT